MKRGDMPAQPVTLQAGEAWSEDAPCADGMTIRERMAMAAMEGLLASGKFQVNDEMAKEAWDAADVMLFWQERTGGTNE